MVTFTAILIGFVSVIIFLGKAANRNWTIKLPDSVPPAIMKPFLSIIPAAIAMYVVGIATYLFNLVTGDRLLTGFTRFFRHRFSACLKVSGLCCLLSFSIRFSVLRLHLW